VGLWIGLADLLGDSATVGIDTPDEDANGGEIIVVAKYGFTTLDGYTEGLRHVGWPGKGA
jgi:hypothetical protein